jgi:hypothetical protein
MPDFIVPEMGVGRCLGPEGNGVSSGEGGEGGPGPPRSEEDKQSVLNEDRTGTTWTRTRRSGQVGCDEEGSARTE